MTDPSQFKEATWILENLKPTIGTFCEVGAFDGKTSSNTLLFEELGWRGILIEADSVLAGQCQLNRPLAKTWCCAAGFEGLNNFYINQADRGLSGTRHKTDLTVPVISMPLLTLLHGSGITQLDLLSIDTEGTELEIWSTVGLATIQPRIVIIEYKTCDEPPQDAAICSRLFQDGYTLQHKTPCNLIFTR